MSMELTYLGTCGNQTATAEATALLLRTPETTLVVDAGPGVVRQIYRAGLKCSDVSAILITHAHGDHSAGFPYLVWSNFYDRLGGATGPSELAVYGMDHVLAGLRANLEFCYNPSAFPFDISWHSLSSEGDSHATVGDLEMTTLPVAHAVPNLGSRFNGDGFSCAYSSDTVYCPEFAQLSQGADLLIHEGFVTQANADLAARTRHSTALEAGRVASEAGVGGLHLVHYFPPLADKLDELVIEARSAFDGEVSVPKELSSLRLGD